MYVIEGVPLVLSQNEEPQCNSSPISGGSSHVLHYFNGDQVILNLPYGTRCRGNVCLAAASQFAGVVEPLGNN